MSDESYDFLTDQYYKNLDDSDVKEIHGIIRTGLYRFRSGMYDRKLISRHINGLIENKRSTPIEIYFLFPQFVLRYRLNSKLNFGKYKGLTVAEVMSESGGFDYLFWVLENLQQGHFALNTEKYIRKTVELRARDRKLNPQNYLHEKTLKDLKKMELIFTNFSTELRMAITVARQQQPYGLKLFAPHTIERDFKKLGTKINRIINSKQSQSSKHIALS